MSKTTRSSRRRLALIVLLSWCVVLPANAAAQWASAGGTGSAGAFRTDADAAAGQGGLRVASGDGASEVIVHGAVQVDARGFLDADHPLLPNTFLLRRARIYVDATMYRWIGFRITPDFAGGRLTLFDAYFEARFSKGAVFRAGKFKVPVGLERLQSGADIRFVERAFPTLVAPNRDLGFGVYGDLKDGRISYASSLTNGVPDGLSGDADTDRGKDVAGRVMVQPWGKAEAARRGALSVGLGASWGRARGTPSLPGLPVVDLTGLDTLIRFRTGATPEATVRADGRRARVSPQASYYRGPFGLMGEYIRSTEDLVQGRAQAEFRMTAWQLAGSWILTGEPASYKGVTPSRPLVPGSGHWGAVEVAARVSGLSVGPSLFPVFADPDVTVRSADALGIAVNWYWNPSVKFVIDYERAVFEGGARGGNRPTAHMLLGRMQFWF